jgi:hypothetical protein
VKGACRAVGISRDTAYEHRKKFHDFTAAWEEAEQFALDHIYSTLLDHAANGTPRPIYRGGVKVGEERVFDHRLAEWLLQPKRPMEFSDKRAVELSGALHSMTEEEEVAAGVSCIESITATIRKAAMAGTPLPAEHGLKGRV